MKNLRHCFIAFIVVLAAFPAKAQITFTDTLATLQGDLIVHVLGHASVLFEYRGQSIYIDPYNKVHDYTDAVKADLILITHADKDHFDTLAIRKIIKPATIIVYTQACAVVHPYSGMDTIMANGDSVYVLELPVKAVPAYNIIQTRHLKGVGNGYVIMFGDKFVYLSGDTEKIPEMEDLNTIDLAFLPLSQPYNMSPEMMAETVLIMNPGIVVPYHYDDADLTTLVELLNDIPDLEIWTGKPVIPSRIASKRTDQVMEIYPNPVSDILYHEKLMLNAAACIYNMAGHLIASAVIGAAGRMDIHYLPPGQYILRIMANDGTFFGKFLKL